LRDKMKPVIKDPVKKVSGLRAVKFESKKSKECAETIKVLKNCLAAAERGEVVGVSIVTVCDDEDSIDMNIQSVLDGYTPEGFTHD